MGSKRTFTEQHKDKIRISKTKPIGTLHFHKTQKRWYIKTVNGWQRRNRWVMEQYLGRPLRKNEDVHHINGDKTDDQIENLELIQHGAHSIKHWTGKNHSDAAREKIKANHWSRKGIVMTRDQNGRFKEVLRNEVPA